MHPPSPASHVPTAWRHAIASVLAACLVLAAPASNAADAGFRVTSPTLRAGAVVPTAQIYQGFGCSGANISPALSWQGAPAGAQSYAITLFDPDAGNGWWHWLVFNIPADITQLAAGAGSIGGGLPPAATTLRNDFGARAYGGPCPPKGDPPHRYVLTVYALDTRLDLPANASPGELLDAVREHVRATATLTTRSGSSDR